MNPLLTPNFQGTTKVSQFFPSAPLVPSTMDASAIQSSSSLNLTPPTTPTSPPNIASLPTDIATTPSTPTTPGTPTPTPPATDPTSSAWKDAFNKVTGLFSQKNNQASDLATQTETAAAPYNQQLNEINTQIKQLQANAIKRQQDIQNSGTPQVYASAESRNLANADAIQGLLLQAQAEGMRGNISLAETHVKNAIDEKYGDINKQIEDAKTNIYNNFDNFTPSEKKQAEMTLLRLDKDDFFAKTQMENDKAVQAVLITAIKQGADNGNPVPTLIMSQASKMTDPLQATQLLAPYLKDAAAIQAKIDAHNTAVATQAKIYQDMALSKEERAQKLKEQASNIVVDPITGKQTSELKLNARQSAATLLDKVTNGNGTSAVGMSRAFGLQYIPGTNAADFKVQFDNLKSILSLDNVKLLKGQGAISDSERALLASAAANLNLSQSDSEFKKNLTQISIGLGNPQEVTLTDKAGKSQKVTVNADTLNQAIADGLKVTY